jgi:hypothetical protein
MASAKTATKDFPSKKEVKDFVTDYQGQEDFIEDVSGDSKRYNPTWPWDIWQDKKGNEYISFYYKINNKKYGSIYYDDEGNQISTKNLKLKLINSYKGK